MGFFDDASNLLYTNPITAPGKLIYDLTRPDNPGPGQDPAQVERNIRATYPDIASLDAALNTPNDKNAGNPAIRQIMLGLRGEYGRMAEQKAKTDREQQSALDQYNKLFSQYSDQAVNRLQRQTAPQRSRLISEEAALGRLDSPVTRYSLNRFDEGANNNLSDLLGQLAGQQATGTIDYSKFNQNLGLQRDSLAQQMAQFNQKNATDKQIAQMARDTAQDKSNSWWQELLPRTTFNLTPKG